MLGLEQKRHTVQLGENTVYNVRFYQWHVYFSLRSQFLEVPWEVSGQLAQHKSSLELTKELRDQFEKHSRASIPDPPCLIAILLQK